MVHNPSLREEPRHQHAPLIPLREGTSILEWLESSGRMSSRDGQDFDYANDEEITDLMGGEDDNSFDDDFDTDDDAPDLDD
jgi:hypothetical protein